MRSTYLDWSLEDQPESVSYWTSRLRLPTPPVATKLVVQCGTSGRPGPVGCHQTGPVCTPAVDCTCCKTRQTHTKSGLWHLNAMEGQFSAWSLLQAAQPAGTCTINNAQPHQSFPSLSLQIHLQSDISQVRDGRQMSVPTECCVQDTSSTKNHTTPLNCTSVQRGSFT